MTYDLGLAQEPLEVVLLDVHQRGDIWDVEAVVVHMLGLEVHLAGQNTGSPLWSDLGPQHVLLKDTW